MKNHEWIRRIAKDLRYYSVVNQLHELSVYCGMIEAYLDEDMQRRGKEFWLQNQKSPTIIETSNQNVITLPPAGIDQSRKIEGQITSPG